ERYVRDRPRVARLLRLPELPADAAGDRPRDARPFEAEPQGIERLRAEIAAPPDGAGEAALAAAPDRGGPRVGARVREHAGGRPRARPGLPRGDAAPAGGAVAARAAAPRRDVVRAVRHVARRLAGDARDPALPRGRAGDVQLSVRAVGPLDAAHAAHDGAEL